MHPSWNDLPETATDTTSEWDLLPETADVGMGDLRATENLTPVQTFSMPEGLRPMDANPTRVPLNPPVPPKPLSHYITEPYANLNTIAGQGVANILHGGANSFANSQYASGVKLAQRAEAAKQRGFAPSPLPPATLPAVYSPDGVLISDEAPNPDYLTAISDGLTRAIVG